MGEELIHETAYEEFCEDEDIYGESLPELAGDRPYARRRDVSKSLDEQRAKAEGWREILMRRGREERLSTSMGEVVVHSEKEGEAAECGGKPGGSRDYLESTRSLTYLEWVHERQTRRMQTRSEWFLSPTAPSSKNGGTSRGEGGRMCYSRISQRFSASPIHLRLPSKKGTLAREEYTSSGDEEMMCCCSSTSGTGGGAGTGCGEVGCGRSGCVAIGGTSTDTSMKCSPRRPDSCCTTSCCGSAGDAQMKSQTGTEEEEAETSDDDAFLADSSTEHQHPFHPHLLTQHPHSSTAKILIGRQPFQLLQERQYSTSTTEGSASAQVTPSAIELCASGKSVGSGRQRFFGSGEQEGGLQALPELSETTTASSPLPRRFSAPYVDISPTDEQNRAEIPATTATQTTAAINVLTRHKHQQKGAKLIQTMSSGSSGSGSGGSGASAQTVIGVAGVNIEQPEISQQQQARILGAGVVRRRSWRTHYTRPKNKSLDSEIVVGVDIREEVTPSFSIPLRCSSPLVFSRRHSSNGDAHKRKITPEMTIQTSSTAPSSARGALIRRKSSSNNNATKSKPPVQTRRSTQI